MKKTIVVLLLFICNSCVVFQPKTFTKAVLNEQLQTLERTTITLQEILEKNKGKKSFIQIFASYCPVSQDSFYDVLALQKQHPEINYIFLSVDHSFYDWKRGLKHIKPKGQFYYIPKKGKGALGKFLKLTSIPRFLVVNEMGAILVYKQSQVSKKIKNKF